MTVPVFKAASLLDRAKLIKPAVSLFAAAAALLGYCAYAPLLDAGACRAFLGMLLLAGGASVLNNIQDRHIDGRIPRTRERPLPGGRLPLRQALVQAAVMIAAGLAVFGVCAPSAYPLPAGLAALVLYNCIYTPLKKKTYLAIIPGAVCGMLPPLIGWLMAGGDPLSTRIWYVMVLFCLWQVPHTWLVLLSCGSAVSDLKIPTFLDFLTAAQLERLIFVWTTIFALLTMYWNYFALHPPGLFILPLLINAFIMPLLFACILLKIRGSRKYPVLFHYLTASMAAVIAVPVLDAVLQTLQGGPH